MSDDLISRSALLERLAFKRDHNRLYQKSTYPGLESAISQVKKAPAVDAVPVVKCKDCIHYYERESVCLKIYSDGGISEHAWQERKPDDFCSYGERKDNGDNESK